LFETIPPSNRTFELFESFENLTKEQGELLKSFERMIKNETPPDSDVNRTEENYLLEAELVNLLDSFEDLLHSQYELIESFDDLLDESKEYLFIESELNFTKLLFSKEDLIRSQDQLLESFEHLIGDLFENVNYNVSVDQKEYFLKSFEDLLMNQSELLKSFEDLLEWWYEQDPPLEDPQPGFWGIYRNFDNKTRNDFGISAKPGGPWPPGPPFTGLVADTLPWGPSDTGLSFSPNFATPPDWYKTPSSLIRIDPAIIVPFFGIGLDFTFLTDECYKEPDFPEELDEGLPGDPCHFTVHWETRITTKNITSVTLTVGCDDDCWVYANGDLIVDCGGLHPYTVCSKSMPVTPGGTYDIDIFYTERYGGGGNLRFGISPEWGITINCPKELCAKKSFEDLLKRQAERIKSFEDLFETIPPSNRTFELFESFENLTKEQGELLKSFEGLIKNEIPPDSDVNRTEGDYLLEAELVNLLDSFEDLLHSQYELIESFDDLLDESKEYLFIESELNFTKLLFSKEDLIRSQDQLLESFEQLIGDLFENVNYNVSIDQKEYFLKSFEDLLMNQSELLKEFEVLLEWWWYKHNLSEPPQVIISDTSEIFAKESFEDLLKRQEERIKRFEGVLENYSAMESDF
jgi:fibro-slime domain-containing protein